MSDRKIGEIARMRIGLRLHFYSVAVGIIAGLVAVLFTYCLQLTTTLLLGMGAGLSMSSAAGEVGIQFPFLPTPDNGVKPVAWLMVLLPALGGLGGAVLVYRWAPEARGAGTDSAIDAFHNNAGLVHPVVGPVKAVASILTLASGGSGGVQGPITQIGATLGSWIGTRLRLSPKHRRILLLAGTAGGLGAIFRAPLGGAMTSVEILYREDFETDALIPCVISSISAYSVFVGVFGFSHIFEFPDTLFTDVREILVYLVLGMVCAGAGIAYIKVFKVLRDRFFDRLPLPRYLVVALGGLLVGLLALIDPRVLGVGFGVLQESIRGDLAVRTLLTLAMLKILATGCSIGSGGSGGVFGPSLFIGGMLGGAVGVLGHQLFPDIVSEPGAYAIVGMASFFGGVANTPLAALIIVTEMTGSYHLLPPLMLVGATRSSIIRYRTAFIPPLT